MTPNEDELSLDEIDAILQETQGNRTTSRTRTKVIERNVMTYFKLPHNSERSCEVPQHDESRPRNKGMTVIINDIAVCRVCFLAGLDRDADSI